MRTTLITSIELLAPGQGATDSFKFRGVASTAEGEVIQIVEADTLDVVVETLTEALKSQFENAIEESA
ncbi:hypothetical protein [Ancylobacter rudongensis]|uniref:Uncharacterized protein n=1 Tax=Ancylobacter rudongensis TaxID=177413 RepID=A0A1G4UPA0_9HYPH|nr:hypothetical protein [Ancylobacter rudongensis]SCW95473.1 hypothetical protein SAMN05660859_0037 [Ancylobacter rudongensis]